MTPRTVPPTKRDRRPRLGAIILVLVLACYFQSASASQMSLSVRIGYAASLGPCSTTPLIVTNTTTGTTATQVTISGLDSSTCSGKTVQLWLRAGASTVTAASDTVNAPSLVLTVPNYAPASVAGAIVYVGGQPITTTWSYAPPVQLPLVACQPVGGGSQTCTVAETTGAWWTSGGVTYWQRTFRVAAPSAVPVPWQVTINLSYSGLPGYAVSLTDLQGGLVLVSTSGCSASPRTVTVKGTTNWGPYNTVTDTRYSEFQVQGATAGTGGLLSC